MTVRGQRHKPRDLLMPAGELLGFVGETSMD
jgi:hypothetical protein